MPRLFHRSEWFFELSPTALAEHEFESLLIQNAETVRPDTHIVPFKKTVSDGERTARADLAIVAADYKEWAVVEVEMIRHDLNAHVIPQIRTLRAGIYDSGHAQYLADRNAALDAAKLADMVRGDSPKVLVLVNKHDEEWAREIRRYDAHMMVFEIFRSESSNRHIFAIDGQLPKVPAGIVSELTAATMLPRFLAVRSPAALEFKAGVRFEIVIDGQMTTWERYDIADQVYISPIGHFPGTRGKNYVLIKLDDSRYEIKTMNPAGRKP